MNSIRTANRSELINICEQIFGKDLSNIISSYIEIPFITIWKIPKNGIIQIPLRENKSMFNNELYIDWGDNTTNYYSFTNSIIHKYVKEGVYAVHISGKCINHYFKGTSDIPCTDLLDITQWGDIQFYDASELFSNCINLKISAIDTPNLKLVEDLSDMFNNCTNLTGDLSKWDVSNIIYMYSMFNGCKLFNSDLFWNVSNVMDMRFLFSDCYSFNGDICLWDVSNVVDIGHMFSKCNSFNRDISNWNVSNVFNMAYTFDNCSSFNGDLSKWNVSKVFNMSFMFRNCILFNGDLSKWDINNIYDMSDMFSGCISFNRDLSHWYVITSQFNNYTFTCPSIK